ncbi:MAG: hypothetical protein HOV79_27915 [Hamadaea sp.]|nr:hypothetical protein [Hamadaea sp.]
MIHSFAGPSLSAAHPSTAALQDAPPLDVAEVIGLAELAERGAGEADQRAAGHERLASTATTELAYLDETGTAPAGPDAPAILDVLVEARIGAVGGLEWLERNITDPRRRMDGVPFGLPASSASVPRPLEKSSVTSVIR